MEENKTKGQLWYKNRNQEEYLSELYKQLDFDNLVKSSIPIAKNENYSYDRIIKIDFNGIAGTTLLLASNKPLQRKIHNRFLELFSRLDELDQLKIRLKTRFLFIYLYSDFSYAQIEAEKTPYRATIENNQFDDFKDLQLFSLTNRDFFSSSIYKNQINALRKLEIIHNKYYMNRNKSDILNIRFTCLPINHCMLTINDKTFIDSYSYAKKK